MLHSSMIPLIYSYFSMIKNIWSSNFKADKFQLMITHLQLNLREL